MQKLLIDETIAGTDQFDDALRKFHLKQRDVWLAIRGTQVQKLNIHEKPFIVTADLEGEYCGLIPGLRYLAVAPNLILFYAIFVHARLDHAKFYRVAIPTLINIIHIDDLIAYTDDASNPALTSAHPILVYLSDAIHTLQRAIQNQFDDEIVLQQKQRTMLPKNSAKCLLESMMTARAKAGKSRHQTTPPRRGGWAGRQL